MLCILKTKLLCNAKIFYLTSRCMIWWILTRFVSIVADNVKVKKISDRTSLKNDICHTVYNVCFSLWIVFFCSLLSCRNLCKFIFWVYYFAYMCYASCNFCIFKFPTNLTIPLMHELKLYNQYNFSKIYSSNL